MAFCQFLVDYGLYEKVRVYYLLENHAKCKFQNFDHSLYHKGRVNL